MRTILLPVLLAASAAAQAPFHLQLGAQPGNALGTAVAAAGDIDGDHVADVVVGAPLDATNGMAAGAIHVLSGADGSTLLAVLGDGALDHFGAAVGGAGDVDGDGFADIVVGAWGDDDGGAESGSVRVYSGRTGNVLYRFDGAAAGDQLGFAVAGAGDVDGDGYDDVIAGAPGADNNGMDAGQAVVWSGRTGAVLFTFDGDSAGDAFGSAVSSAGDFDGDGLADLLVGAPGDDDNGAESGTARVLAGAGGAVLKTFAGDGAGDAFGSAVCGLGDVDGDGYGDVAAGAPGDDDRGAESGSARVFSGLTSAILYTMYGDFAMDAFGTSLASAGDHDGDGIADLIVGAPGADRSGQDAGAAQLFSGADGHLLWSLFGNAAGDAFGTSVAGAGDANGDGYADLLVGAPGDDRGGADAGSTAVFARLPLESIDEAAFLTPAPATAQFGYDVAGVGDIDKDGVPDYMVGAPFDLSRFGKARVISGATNAVLFEFTGPAPDIWFGQTVSAVGDVDGDGYIDVAVGAWHADIAEANDVGLCRVFSGRDGSVLKTLYGSKPLAHMGAAIAPLGDVDGDGRDDFLVTLGLNNNESGSLRVYSGANFSIIYQVDSQRRGDWFGWSAGAVGDIDGDGVTDFVIGAPSNRVMPTAGAGYADLRSGATGALIRRVRGNQVMSNFGWSVDGLGDVNGDGIGDFVVGAFRQTINLMTDTGMARVFSGADGTVLYEVVGQRADEFFGRGVGNAGDVDGDGYADFIVGAPAAALGICNGVSRAVVYSGHDGRQLREIIGTTLCDDTGISESGIGDVDGDGFGDFVIGADMDDTGGMEAGAARVYLSTTGSDPGVWHNYGTGCPGSNGKLARISLSARPRIGTSSDVLLRSSVPQASVLLSLDTQPASIDLALIMMPGCTALALPVATMPASAGTAGEATATLSFPPSASFVGASLYGQWLIVDPGANPTGVAVSNGLQLTLGL